MSRNIETQRTRVGLEGAGLAPTALRLRYPGTLWSELVAVVFSRDGARARAIAATITRTGRGHVHQFVSLKRPLDESPWLQLTSECQRL